MSAWRFGFERIGEAWSVVKARLVFGVMAIDITSVSEQTRNMFKTGDARRPVDRLPEIRGVRMTVLSGETDSAVVDLAGKRPMHKVPRP